MKRDGFWTYLDTISQISIHILILTMLKLPSKENIENQALQMELNEAVQNEDKSSQDNHLVDELRAKVRFLISEEMVSLE
jgi:hypothetical protein